jgi:hypothetical protein
MDEEMNFPNPVTRTDLPTPRRKLPRVLMGLAALLILGVVFLPQILSSKVGRKIVVSYLSAKTNSAVTLGSFKTSWFGGTSVQFLSIADPMNRRIGCKSLTCKASLWNLIRGKYRLGDAEVEGLNFDYVINDGRGRDTFDRMSDSTPEVSTASPPPPADRSLPELSGKIVIKDGTIILHRGTVQPLLYDVTWQQGRLQNVQARLEIKSLDKPWTYTFSADVVDGDAEPGSITSSGTVDLGENGQEDPRALTMDVKLSGENVRTGALGAALIPAATPAEVREALGDVLDRVDLAVKASNGVITVAQCDASGRGAHVHVRPKFDVSTRPPVMAIEGEASTVSLGVSNRLAQEWLVYLCPFFRDAVGGRGVVNLTVEELHVPLVRQGSKAATARGRVDAQHVVLTRKDEMTASQTLPDNMASQLALLTGGSEKEMPLQVDGAFSAANGRIIVSPMRTAVGETVLSLEGSTQIESGAIQMSATLAKSPEVASILQTSKPSLSIPIAGTIQKPEMSVFNVKGDLTDASYKTLNDAINDQITRMRAKETQRLMQKSENQVEEILRPLQPPTTRERK